jgi:hypothetical protein
VKWIKERLPYQSSPIEEQILNVLLNDRFSTNDFEADDRRATAEDYEVCEKLVGMVCKWWAISDGRNARFSKPNCNVFYISTQVYTSNGSLVGPPEIQVEDEVRIVHGGRMPLIFRPNEQSFRPVNSETGQKCHTFVGDSYIYGIMDGEAASDLEGNSVDVFLV